MGNYCCIFENKHQKQSLPIPKQLRAQISFNQEGNNKNKTKQIAKDKDKKKKKIIKENQSQSASSKDQKDIEIIQIQAEDYKQFQFIKQSSLQNQPQKFQAELGIQHFDKSDLAAEVHKFQQQRLIHLDSNEDNQQPIKTIVEIQTPSQPLNQRFQNSVSQSSVRYSSQQRYDQQISFNGLPNIGNTCYLNAVLQMLYSAQRFRKVVIKQMQQHNQFIFHRYISNIFEDITNHATKKTKRKHLQKLNKYLQGENANFALFKQSDAVQCLLEVLNSLQEEDPNCSKLKYFKIKYEPRCQCTKNGNNILLQCYLVKSGEICAVCQKQIQYYIYNTGPYLLVMSHQNFKFKNHIKFVNKDKNNLFYENKAFITYYGNSYSGHYISHRKTQTGWISISDSSVQFIGNLDTLRTAPILTLYQFKKRKI